MRKRKSERHVEGTVLASLVLISAASAAIILLVTMAGGTTGANPNIPKSCRTVPASRSPIITLPPDEPHGSVPLTSPATTPATSPRRAEPVVAPPAPGGTSTPISESVTETGQNIHQWYADNAIKVEREWQAALARRRLVWQIDTWLSQRGSPMTGTAETYVQNQERTGIPATLSVGIAEAESTSGMRCYNNPPGGCSHNAFGMIGYPGGWSTWQEAITANFDYLVRWFGCPQTMRDCPGYCEGDGTMATVDDVQAAINRLDAGWIR